MKITTRSPIWLLLIIFTHSVCVVSAQDLAAGKSAALKRKTEHIDFKGVSFDFDRAKLGAVTASEVPESRQEMPDTFPDGFEPRHVSFTFDSGNEGWNGALSVYPVKQFPEMFAVNKPYKRFLEKEIAALRRSIVDSSYRFKGEIPYLPFVDAVQEFQARVKLSRFRRGKGIYFVTYLATEEALIANDHLRYIFEGLTNDGKYYVLAEIPVSVKFLAYESPEEFEGYKRDYLAKDRKSRALTRKRYRSYFTSITSRLEKLPDNGFQPNLSSLRQLIATLKIAN